MSSIKHSAPLKMDHDNFLLEDTLPTEGITLLYGIDGDRNSQVAFELALSVATGRSWQGREVPSKKHVLYLTIGCKNEFEHRIEVWRGTNQVNETSLFSWLKEPIDLLNKNKLHQLLKDTYYSKHDGFEEYPDLVVVDIQQGPTDEFNPNKLINIMNYLRKIMGSAFLLVFNNGVTDGDCDFPTLFDAVDTAHRVTPIDEQLGIHFRCSKMDGFHRPFFIQFYISCNDDTIFSGVV